jgi:hypothetical protein
LTPDELRAFHAEQAKKATELYLVSRTPAEFDELWHVSLRSARRLIAAALRESKMLSQVDGALVKAGTHMRAFRHLMAPPMSQDQFALFCAPWRKTSEKPKRKLKPIAAKAAAQVFHDWRHKQLTAWVDKGTAPSRAQLRRVLSTVAPLIASQDFGTRLRNKLAKEQEGAIIAMLDANGWQRVPSRLVDKRAMLEPKQYMYKTKFATSKGRHEVDVACGLKDTYVLAMECKVTNDQTNSMKRVNDVLKKANAWRTRWGESVEPAALLQGVIAAKDVSRLLDEGVYVFWSHDVEAFQKWLATRV